MLNVYSRAVRLALVPIRRRRSGPGLSVLARQLVGAGLWLMGATALAQTGDDVERGRELYMRNGCFSCHGTVGQGGERSGAPKLAPDTYLFEVFKLLVRTPREAMPRFDPRYVSDEDLLAMHRYLSAQPRATAAREIPALQSLMR